MPEERPRVIEDLVALTVSKEPLLVKIELLPRNMVAVVAKLRKRNVPLLTNLPRLSNSIRWLPSVFSLNIEPLFIKTLLELINNVAVVTKLVRNVNVPLLIVLSPKNKELGGKGPPPSVPGKNIVAFVTKVTRPPK